MTRLNRTDWLEQGLLLIVKLGVDTLTIEAICNHLQVTKGSFYHHFKNRQAFLEALLQYWEETYTTQFIDVSREGQSIVEQLERITALVISNHGTQEVTIRAWAQTDALAREYQERVDQRRIDFIYELQHQLSGDEQRARLQAKLIYAVLIGAQQMMPAASQDELAQMYKLLETINRKP